MWITQKRLREALRKAKDKGWEEGLELGLELAVGTASLLAPITARKAKNEIEEILKKEGF